MCCGCCPPMARGFGSSPCATMRCLAWCPRATLGASSLAGWLGWELWCSHTHLTPCGRAWQPHVSSLMRSPTRACQTPGWIRNCRDCLRRTWRSGGISGLYAGYVASMLEIAPYTAIAFTSYEGVKQRLQGHLPPWAAKICAGVCSGCAATGVCYPLDTVRRQLMLDGALGFDCRYHGSIVRCCRSLCSQGGLVQFYKGWSVTMLKSVPTVTITFFTKDFLLTKLRQ
ncbi:unnamed protein product [Effrenium voratum]|uniref:Uncharacterized protein n=1 Tax=Effrenium voratum TaxID=2562239 RepID=A0AA36I6A6_9DINO|nr:unnamed protein product [Effrenium voratum]